MSDTRPLALVTGASSGIGFEIADQLAQRGYDLLVTAEDAGIDAAAQRLAERGGDVRATRADLRSPTGVEQVNAAVTAAGRPLAVAALNAGVGKGGAFVDSDLASQLDIVDLNVRSTVHLAKLLIDDMVARDDGRVLITSSIASTMPGSFQAVYNASKSFLQSLAEALQDELRDSAVVVTSLMPGPTETSFFDRAEMTDTRVGQSKKDDPAQVAKQGVDALLAGKDRVVGGSLKTKAQEAANKVLPDSVKAAAHRKMAEPKES
jgi:short-subunit dehydrogenase